MSRNIQEMLQGVDPKFRAGAQVVIDTATSLAKQGLLPERLQEVTPPKLIIPEVSEERYDAIRRELEVDSAIIAIEALSLQDLKDQHPEHFAYINPSSGLRALVPQAMEVAIRREDPFIPGSEQVALDGKLAMIEEFGQKLGIEGTSAIALNASGYAQADIAWEKVSGKPLLTHFFAQTPDQTVRGSVACVGRDDPDNGLDVDDWYRGGVHPIVVAVPAVVLPRKIGS